jgi:hypothetical protein
LGIAPADVLTRPAHGDGAMMVEDFLQWRAKVHDFLQLLSFSVKSGHLSASYCREIGEARSGAAEGGVVR